MLRSLPVASDTLKWNASGVPPRVFLLIMAKEGRHKLKKRNLEHSSETCANFAS